jgi:hypothetical protein
MIKKSPFRFLIKSEGAFLSFSPQEGEAGKGLLY